MQNPELAMLFSLRDRVQTSIAALAAGYAPRGELLKAFAAAPGTKLAVAVLGAKA